MEWNLRRGWLRTRRFIAQKVLHTDDTPHAVALGAAIAMFIAFLPLIGLQTILSISLAALFRANKAVCIPIVWITNPFTAVPIYGPCLLLGRFLLGVSTNAADLTVLSELEKHGKLGLLDAESWIKIFHRLTTLGVELWVGCAVVGGVLAMASYFFARWGVVAYRERRRQRQLRRSLFRAQLRDEQSARRSGAV